MSYLVRMVGQRQASASYLNEITSYAGPADDRHSHRDAPAP